MAGLQVSHEHITCAIPLVRGSSVMASTVPAHAPTEQRERFETVRPRMAKALTKSEMRTRVGKAVARCFQLADVNQSEAADLIERDRAQVARWTSGDERPQFDAILAVERLRPCLVIALAELVGVECETVIRVKRIA